MIFVVLGTQKFQLNRLLRSLDEFVEKGTIIDDITAQTGNSDYKPKHYIYYPFLGKDEFESHISKADLIISHGGVGSIMTALNNEKPVIIFPRLSKYHEHVDDHQTEIARAFNEKGYALLCDETDDLSQLIEKSKTFAFNKYVSQTDKIVGTIEDFFLENL